MDEWEALKDFSVGYWIAGGFALLECFKWLYTIWEWLFSKFGIETKNMRHKREMSDRLKKAEDDIVEIKETAKANVAMFIDHEKKVLDSFVEIKEEVVKQLHGLNTKFDEHKEQLEEKLEVIDREGKSRSAAILRDRILGGLRYFGQNKDDNGNVHISMSDFENMSHLFDEYESAGGNGMVKHLKETQFKHFIIDNEPFEKF